MTGSGMGALGISFVVSLGVLIWMLHMHPTWVPLDLPNARSLHKDPVPRGGGLGVVLGASAGWLVAGSWELSWALPAIGLALVSSLDDRHGLPVGVRLAAHTLAAAAFAWFSEFQLSWSILLGALLLMVWLTNLYNFMDGADGLAGAMAVIGFGAYAFAAAVAGENNLMLAAGCVAAGAAAFLVFNAPPARIFMGDVGSIPIGFLAGALGLEGWIAGVWPWWFPLFAFSPFIVDATVTLVRRIAGRTAFWHAHRDHAYQRLVRSGWSHERLFWCELALMVGVAVTGVLMLRAPVEVVIGISSTCFVLYVLLFALVERRWKQYVRMTS
jgi:UDP-N-acetylmuramyl pentapeptide phosphotransferase/UDP-N-acetylglucosamine-1-phosphate transferase